MNPSYHDAVTSKYFNANNWDENGNNKQRTLFAVVTNFDFENEDDFRTLSAMVWNEILLLFLDSIILKNYPEDGCCDSMIVFLEEMFLSEESDAIQNVCNFISNKDINLLFTIFEHRENGDLKISNFKGKYKNFKPLHKLYCDFMQTNIKTIMKNKSLMCFYSIFCYFLQCKNVENYLYEQIKSINYYLVNQIKDLDSINIFAGKEAYKNELDYILGLFISPAFLNGSETKDYAERIFNIHKKLLNVIDNQYELQVKNGFVGFLNQFILGYKCSEPLFMESNYNITNYSNIYDNLNSCFWLMKGFNGYYRLNEFFYLSVFGNPNSFKSNVFKNSITSNKNLTKCGTQKLKPNNQNIRRIYTAGNYITDIYIDEQLGRALNVNNLFTTALLNYTILRLAQKRFELYTNEDDIHFYFDLLKIVPKNYEENISKKLNQCDITTVDDRCKQNIEIKNEKDIEKEIKKETEKETEKESKKEIERESGNEGQKESKNKREIEVKKEFNEVSVKECNEENVNESREENSDENSGETSGESYGGNGETEYLKNFFNCLICYKELTSNIKKMGIENIENVYSIYYFFEIVCDLLDESRLDKKIITDEFYESFNGKKLKVDIFNTITNIINTCDNDKKAPTDIENDDTKKLCENDAKQFENGDIVNLYDLKNKHVIYKKKDLTEIEIKCDDDEIILVIFVMSGLKAILTSVASYKTVSEYIRYLAEIPLKLDLKSNADTDENSFINKEKNEISSMIYSSKKFQKIVEQTFVQNASMVSMPSIFHYNFYIFDWENEEINFMKELSDDIKKEINYILDFDDRFLNEFKNVHHVYVFNIVYINYFLVKKVVNLKHTKEHLSMLKNLHELVVKYLKSQNINLPKFFVIKHDNMDLNMETENYDGKKMKDYYLFSN